MTVTRTRTVDPAQEPITLTEAKAQARITDSNSDGLVASWVATARWMAEDTLGYGLFTQTWRADFSAFEDVMPLPMALQLQSVTHVKYYDTTGTLQTLSSSYYELDTMRRPAGIVRAADVSWPALQADRRVGLVQVTYVVGWTTIALIPERIKQGIRMYVTYLDADRDGMETQAGQARAAAEACWSDRLYYIPPSGGVD